MKTLLFNTSMTAFKENGTVLAFLQARKVDRAIAGMLGPLERMSLTQLLN